MNVLLTGAGGFIGRALRAALQQAGHGCIAPSSTELNLLDAAAVAGFLREAQPTHLVHSAWRAVHGDAMASADNVAWLRASLALADAFHANGGERAAFLGSCAEYDWSFGVLRTGVTPLAPRTPYGAAKHSLHLGLQALADATGFSFVWPRLFFVYGPGEHASRLTMATAGALLRGEPVDLTHGRQIRDFVFVRDAADGVVAALSSDLQGETDLASGTPRAVRDVALEIARQLGREDLLRFGARPSPAHDLPVVVGDPAHARDTLGWTASTSLEDGVAELISWARTIHAH